MKRVGGIERHAVADSVGKGHVPVVQRGKNRHTPSLHTDQIFPVGLPHRPEVESAPDILARSAFVRLYFPVRLFLHVPHSVPSGIRDSMAGNF
jgi:hypothetical protein